MNERIGKGPWARLLASAVLPDEGSSLAERGRALVRLGAVRDLIVTTGVVTGRVGDCDVTIGAEPVPPRIWAAMTRSARGNGQLETAVEGREQSVHLEYLMTADWEQPLVPRTTALARHCTCGGAGGCEHLAALAYAFAQEIDRDPSILLRWRGCEEAQEEAEPAVANAPAVIPEDAWEAGPLPAPRPLRPLPTGAVLKRLGPSGLRVGGTDLAELLQRAYASFAASPRR
jgi:uncharacterized Zn finger protein